MRFLKEQAVMRRIRAMYPFDKDGYFYNGKCGSLKSISLSTRVGLERMIRVTVRYARQAGADDLIGFTDGLAGWRGTQKAKRFSPIEITVDELTAFVDRRLHFRDSDLYADNYYFTDSSLDWFAVFCHEGDWHLFSRRRLALSSLSLR